MKLINLRITLIAPDRIGYAFTSVDPTMRLAAEDLQITVSPDVATLTQAAVQAIGHALLSADPGRLRRESSHLTAAVFPPGVTKLLDRIDSHYLYLDIEPECAGLPWELMLLPDGSFLGQRFSTARNIRARSMASVSRRELGHDLTIVADPDGTLANAATEGEAICRLARGKFDVAYFGNPSRYNDMLGALGQADLFHFSGHASASGMHLADCILGSEAISELPRVPLFVFLNACDGDYGLGWEGSHHNLVRALLEAGSHAVLAARAPIESRRAQVFAERFYLALFERGLSIADAMQHASAGFEQDDMIWAAYVLYGNPILKLSPKRVTTEKTVVAKFSKRIAVVSVLTLALGIAVFSTEIKRGHSPAILSNKAAVELRPVSEVSGQMVMPSKAPPASLNPVMSLPVVALLPLEWDSKPENRAVIANSIETMLIDIPNIRLVERRRIDAVIGELRLQASELSSPLNAGRIGQLLGADFLIMGSVLEVGSERRIDLRIVKVATAEIVGVASKSKGGSLHGLGEAVAPILSNAIGKIHK